MEEILLSGTAQLKKEFQDKKEKIVNEFTISVELFTEWVLANDTRYNNPKGYDRIKKTFYGYVGDLYLLGWLKSYHVQKMSEISNS